MKTRFTTDAELDELLSFLATIIELQLNGDLTMDRVDKQIACGKVSIYWVGDLLRIDLKPS